MAQEESNARGGFPKLKQAFYTGIIVLLAWIGIAGGGTLLLSGLGSGLFLLLLGLAFLVFRFTPAYASLVDREVAWKGIPALVFVVSALLVLMIGWVARVFILDPFVLYNRENSMSLILWSVATLLSVGTLIANIVAYRLDNRKRG